MSLRDYEGAKFELAEILRAAIALAGDRQDAVREQAAELFSRLAEDRFYLLVVGRFSRGKSSLMNAVLGTDRLLTGVLPVTSVITSVQYANPEALLIEYQGNGFGFEVPMDKLAEYTTERGNPGNQRGVQVARVGLPAEILRRGFFFVDSPGLGSAIVRNTRTTEAFLSEADALLMVSGFDGPLSDDEVRVLRLLGGSQLQLFLVLNKQDTVSVEERQDVCEFVRARLSELWGGRSAQVFSLSALRGLAAKISGDRAALEASGLAGFERELARFLLEEKGGAFLVSTCERVMRVLAALEESPELNALRERIAAVQNSASSLEARAQGPIELPAIAQAGRRAWDRCDLCRAVHERLFEFLTQYQHDLAAQPQEAQRLAEAGGLCGPHLRLYASLAAERDICVALTPLLKHWSYHLATSPPRALAAMHARCGLCELQGEVEHNMIGQWQDATAQTPHAADSHSLCLPHFQKVVATLGDHAGTVWVANQARALERLSEDMQRYVVKRDGIRSGLTTQDETRAAQRALAVLAGARTLVTRN